MSQTELDYLQSELEFEEKMTVNEYADLIFELFPINDLHINTLGLCGEAGEFANKLKKRLYKDISNAELIDELGDVLWHVAQCAKLLNTDMQTLMVRSLRKTKSRNSVTLICRH